ncbi:protein kilB [Streptomyces sp. NPDC004539]|uniref:protein kilB n=1 Tax=Streptomyces sp. NPDC004539 TaxID=3154280 RepID=UPI0033BBEA5A
MWSSVIAVAGTLLGGLLAGFLQQRGERAARRERREEALRTALGELVAALGDHRRALWHREELRLNGAEESALTAARTTSQSTRSALTAPLVSVSVLEPTLSAPARAAVLAAVDLRDVPDLETLSARREAAIKATDELVAAAGRLLAT